jgi:hypothetical protein
VHLPVRVSMKAQYVMFFAWRFIIWSTAIA